MVKKISNFFRWCLSEQPTLARLTLNKSFRQAVCHLRQGTVLEIGSGKYNTHCEYLRDDCRYFSLNLAVSEKPAVAGDARLMPFKDGSFEGILILEVLEHIPTPDLLIMEIMRVMRVGGIMIGSTRFIHPQHGAPNDYYRFTAESLELLFSEYGHCRVEKLGNRLHVLSDIVTENYRFLRIFNRLIQYIQIKPTTCYSGLLFIVKK
jgi:SAM-dependent methyltransferase